MDGSGYHRGLTGSAVSTSGRILAAACAYRAMVEPRAHRPAMVPRQAAGALRTEVRAGRLDTASVNAVLAAAGTGRAKRVSGPAGLTPREVEVLILRHPARWPAALIPGAELNGTVPMWQWIGDEPATTFSY
jgi:hypothetical protein